MKPYKSIYITFSLLVLLAATSCDSTYMDETYESAPQIDSFSPESGCTGDEIIVLGTYLDDVVQATIGGQEVTISQKVSNTRLSLTVTSNAVTGPIVLTNSIGEGTSDGSFTVTYPVPELDTSELASEAEMGGKLLLTGTHLNVVTAVIFTATGYTTGNEATILAQTTTEILVTVPYVEAEEVSITLRYNDGSAETETSLSTAPTVSVSRNEPVVTTTTFDAVEEGESVTLEGTHLDKVEAVTLGGIDCTISSQTETSLTFTVPSSSDYEDGENVFTLTITYFSGTEVVTVTDAFIVYVSPVYFWEDITIYAQARQVVEEFISFFSPETGIAYANELWSTTVDPIAYAYQSLDGSVTTKPEVTEEEYDSVNPYLFISGMSAGDIRIYSPGSSGTVLRNFYTSNSSTARITGSSSSSSTVCFGTPYLSFLYLDPTNSTHAEVVEMVLNGEIDTIDEETFPIDEDAKTCRGISITGMSSASCSSDKWASGVFTVGTESTATDLDAVVLVIYYDVNGPVSKSFTENIKRIGLMRINSAHYLPYSGNTPSGSSITFDMYWQKHDYDYDKLSASDEE